MISIFLGVALMAGLDCKHIVSIVSFREEEKRGGSALIISPRSDLSSRMSKAQSG